MPTLASLLEVSEAVARQDDGGLMGLVQSSQKPQDVFRQIRQSAPFTTHAIEGVTYYEHSLLWLMPVVTRSKYPSVACKTTEPKESQGPYVAAWLREWFGPANHVKCVDFMPSYELMGAMTPGHVRNTLDAIVKPSSNAALSFSVNDGGDDAPRLVPDLAFFLGTLTRVGTPPAIPQDGRSLDILLKQRSAAAIGMWAGVANPDAAFVLGTPSVFGDAILAGLLMWVREVELEFDGLEWNASPVDSDIVAIEWVVRDRANGDLIKIARTIRYSQIGSEGADLVLSAIAGACALKGANNDLLCS